MNLLQPGIPVILQSERAECAIACFCMIACSHGYELDLLSARQRFSASLKGATVADIVNMASLSSMQARALKLEVDEMSALKLPAILHWGMNHFVVLTKITRRGYVVHDPAVGKRLVSRREVNDGFTGIAVECTPAPDFSPQPRSPGLSLRDLFASTSGLPRLIAEIFGLSILLQLLALLLPYVFQLVVDDVLVSYDQSLLLAVCAGLAFLGLFETAINAVRQWGIDVAGAHLSRHLSTGMMQHLLRLPLPFFEKRNIGDILTRMGSMQALQTAMTTTLAGLLVDGVVVICTATVMFFYSPVLGWLVTGSLVLLLCIRLALYPVQRRLQDSLLHQQAREQTHSIETLRAMHSIRSANGEEQRLSTWSVRFTGMLRAGLGLARFNLQTGMLESAIQALLHVGVIYVAATQVLTNPQLFTVGMLFAFLAYKNQFIERANSLVEHVLSCRLLDLHLQRVGDILLAEPELQPSQHTSMEVPTTDITLKGLGFRYGPQDPWVLRNLSCTLPAGRLIAIVGSSGSGKTTLMKLLLGLYSPVEGEVQIGGRPLDRAYAPLWRRRLGIVLQEDQLISGTIADNIALLTGDLDLERVQHAAALAGIHEEICLMPMGYLSLVGDLGSSLSSGQKQRLLIARALYRQPEVLFMDEGTAHLDPAREAQLCEVLANLQITRVVVAHRPALIQKADLILSLTPSGLIDITSQYQTSLPLFERLDAT